MAAKLLSELPVTAMTDRLGLPQGEADDLLETLRWLGIRTLGELAVLPLDAVADRFGPSGLRALRIARGEDDLLACHLHVAREELAAEIGLPEGTAGNGLERALVLLVDRFLAASQRKGRTLLGLRLGALLNDGESWSVEQGLGRPTASARVLRTVLMPRLEELPGPPVSLWLRSVGFGARAAEQMELSVRSDEYRRRRLGAALREVRDTQGAAALLRVLPVDTASRLPERREALTPGPKGLYAPLQVAVRVAPGGAPRAVAGVEVETVREEWLVEDRWWTPRPLRRHYFELVLADGRNVTVFRSACNDRWYRQRA